MIDLTSIKGRHLGQRAVVLGGGPSLLGDLRRVRPRFQHLGLWFGVNQHALLLELDYIVYQDKELHPILIGNGVPLITHHKDACDIWSGIVPDFGFSTGTAVWVAEYLGCEEIVICGCDDYTSPRRYWHSKMGDRGLEMGVTASNAWKRVYDHLREPQNVRAVSGPITKVFGTYEG
jgi:hypothetical protein